MPLESGQALGHYTIVRSIGQGGMGEVYLAEDTRLQRKVALKVLPGAVSSDADRLARFEREARAVAALNHPHIVTIYSVEEAAGIRFLTMELVEGDSLDHALPPGGLPLAKVFDIGIALADALTAAHEKGIVHRDLKPANVMVTKDGRVKVLDFGLAKLASGGSEAAPSAGTAGVSETATALAAHSSLTGAGVVVGTVPYMSPEQVGSEAVDTRTDIFSLGVVLYELATGRRPFQGKNNAETISSILRDVPRPVTEARQDAPRHLARIIDHCLQKDPEARFQTAKDVRNELRALRGEVESSSSAQEAVTRSTTSGVTLPEARSRKGRWIGVGLGVVVVGVIAWILLARWGDVLRPSPRSSASAESAAAGPDPRSIAVLPFVDMSQAKDQEYFSDGISEELLNLLAKVPQLQVVARTSSFSFKGKPIEIPEIARQLHVANVLEGSVRKAGDQVRITAQLIHAADGFHLWSETYDRKLDDIFKIQDEIAGEVVKQLKITLLAGKPTVRTTDPKAYALYLQAKQLVRQSTAEGFEKSDALLHQVLEIDPRYAPAWNSLANSFANKANMGMVPSQEGLARGRAAAEKALAIDPHYAPAHAALGYIAMLENDDASAAKHYERALTLDPTELNLLGNASNFLLSLGRLDEAVALNEAVAQRDPVNTTTLSNLGAKQLYSGRYDEAIVTFRTVLSLTPGRGSVHEVLGEALLHKGDGAGALAEIEQEPIEVNRMIGLPMAYHALGRNADSDAALAALIAKYEKSAPYNIAYVCAYRGEADQAFAWLDKAIEYHDTGLAEIVHEQLFDKIHSDPRWLPFLRKIGKAPEQLAKIKFKVTLPPQ